MTQPISYETDYLRWLETQAQHHASARRDAAQETGLEIDRFPESCPWTIEQVLDEDYWPDQGR